MNKQQFIQRVKASITEVLERSRDKWVSVMEPGASFGAILVANGVNKKYTPQLLEVLTANGLIERDGRRTGIRYRYQPQDGVTPDIDKLAEKTYETARAYHDAYRPAGGPKRVTPPRDVNQNGKATRLKGNLLPNIGDSRYILLVNAGVAEIIEAKVVGIIRDPEDGRYAFHVVYRLPESEELKYMARLSLHDLYVRPEDVCAHLTQTMVRFHGELFPTIKRETVKQNGR